jgi:hypothetical protein
MPEISTQITNSKFPEWACSLSWLFEESCSSQLLPLGPVDPAELALKSLNHDFNQKHPKIMDVFGCF